MSRQRWLEEERGVLAAERLLDAAAECFAREGVASTQMSDVARAAGCSRATLYRYFESRRALQSAFVDREARRIAAAVGRDVAGIDDPAARVVEAVLAAVSAVRDDATLHSWFTEGGVGIATAAARASEVIEAIGADFLGDATDAGARARSAWLVRVIVSLLAMPGQDAAAERELVERFVAPVVVEGHAAVAR